MHVLMVTGDLRATAGGPPQVMFETARALAAKGVRVSLFALAGGTPEADPDFTDLPVEIRRFAVSGIARLSKSAAMRRAIAQRIGEFDALHCHGVWEGALADASAIFRRAGKPVFDSAHGKLDPWSLGQSRWRKRAALALGGTGRMLAQASAIVFATADEAQAARHPGAPAQAIVPNGVDPTKLAAELALPGDRLRAAAPMLRAGQRVVLYFGRIHPKKGLDLLVEAFVRAAPEHPDAVLLVVGIPQDRGFQSRIEQRIAASGLAERIAIVTDLAGPAAKPALGLAALFALPSHQEGFSMAILEAMGAGLPVLITEPCHFPEVATHGCGRVTADDLAGVERGLRELLALPAEELAALGRNARALVADAYALPRIADRLIALYAGGEAR